MSARRAARNVSLYLREEKIVISLCDQRARALLFRVVLSSVLLASCVSPALAQQAVTSATLSGRVEDADGAALGGVRVTATNLETNQARIATSDAEGRYRFA